MSFPTHSNYILLENYDAVFCSIPKVACTGWKVAARRLMGEQNWENPKLAHDRKRSGLHLLSAQTSADLNRIQGCSLRLGMVRNPYTRLLSAYLDKVDRRQNSTPPLLGPGVDYWSRVVHDIERFARHQDQGKFRRITFEIFLRWLSQSNHEAVMSAHWVPQANLTGMGQIDWTLLGRFESLHSDATAILELLGASFSFPVVGQRHATSAAENILKHYSAECVAIVNELLSDDFELFNYPKAESVRDLGRHGLEMLSS